MASAPGQPTAPGLVGTADVPVICATCAVEHAAAPAVCAICADERQWVPADGQQWITLEQLGATGRRTHVRELEPDLFGITVQPKVGIGQQALVARHRVAPAPTTHHDEEPH